MAKAMVEQPAGAVKPPCAIPGLWFPFIVTGS
jgi:hypothetical protein